MKGRLELKEAQSPNSNRLFCFPKEALPHWKETESSFFQNWITLVRIIPRIPLWSRSISWWTALPKLSPLTFSPWPVTSVEGGPIFPPFSIKSSRLFLGSIYPNSPSVNHLPIQGSNGFICSFILLHFHKAKSTGLVGKSITNHLGRNDGTKLSKNWTKPIFSCSETKISNINFLRHS